MLILLLILSFLLNYPFIFSHSSFGDWFYRTQIQLIGNYLNVYSAESWKILIRFTEYLFGLMNFDSSVSDTFLYHVPILILPIIIAYTIKRDFGYKTISTVAAALVLIANTYTISSNSVGHNLITVALYLYILSFLFLIRSVRPNTSNVINRPIILSSIFILLTGSYDIRILYIGLITHILFLVYFSCFGDISWKKIIKSLAFFFGVMLIYFTPSIIDLLLIDPDSHTITTILSRELFTQMQPSIWKSINLFHPYWSVQGIKWFVVRDVPIYLLPFAFIPFMSALILRSVKKPFERRFYLFILLLTLLGIFLSKQNNIPFTEVYKFFYHSIPGFSAFREPTKFYCLIIIGYTFLIPFIIDSFLLKVPKKVHHIIVGVFIIPSIVNILAILLSPTQTLYKRTENKSIVVQVEKLLIDNIQVPSRILWLNTPVLYKSNKYQAIRLNIDDNCQIINNGGTEQYSLPIDSEFYKISAIMTNNSVPTSCLMLVTHQNIKKIQSTNINEAVFTLYRIEAQPVSPIFSKDISIMTTSLNKKFYDPYFISFIAKPLNNKNINIYLHSEKSKYWLLIVDSKFYFPSIEENNNIVWNIPSSNQNLKITIINWRKLLIRYSIIVPISTLLLLLFKYKHEKSK